MENKQKTSSSSQINYPSVVGDIFSIVFNFILLTLLSLILLEIVFCFKILFFNKTDLIIENILNYNMNIMIQYHLSSTNTILNLFQFLQNNIHAICSGFINENIIQEIIDIIEMVLTRLYLFVEYIPFITAIFFVFIIDGFVLRDKRKFQGARESTFLFHRIKSLIKVSFFSLYFLYLVNPYELAPVIFLIPMTVITGLFATISIKNFKKYL